MSNKLNMSYEAQFHRHIKVLPWCSKRMQGEVMGAFRAVVPKDMSEAATALHDANMAVGAAREEADRLVACGVDYAKRNCELAKSNEALKEQVNLLIADRNQLALELDRARKASKQSRTRSAAETLVSTTIGFFGSLAITWAVVSSMSDVALASLLATLGCTVWSFTRGYSVRRYFESLR